MRGRRVDVGGDRRIIRGMPDANTLTAEEKAEGFRLLFDGRSLDGWRTYNQATPDAGWRVEGDSLVFRPAPDPQYGHDLMTIDTFASFELRVDWKLWAKGNSGLFFHVREAPGRACYMSGVEYQLLDDTGHPDALNGPLRLTGACYALYAPAPKRLMPLGEWNQSVIRVEGDRAQYFLNGGKTVDFVMGSQDWNDRVAQSKFAEWPAFASERAGHLLLQDHKDPVAFRNIRVKTL